MINHYIAASLINIRFYVLDQTPSLRKISTNAYELLTTKFL